VQGTRVQTQPIPSAQQQLQPIQSHQGQPQAQASSAPFVAASATKLPNSAPIPASTPPLTTSAMPTPSMSTTAARPTIGVRRSSAGIISVEPLVPDSEEAESASKKPKHADRINALANDVARSMLTCQHLAGWRALTLEFIPF
jgi:hypothetical protein